MCHPFAHLRRGNGQAGVAVVPTDNIKGWLLSERGLAVGVVPYLLPLRELLGGMRLIERLSWPRVLIWYDIGHQTLLPSHDDALPHLGVLGEQGFDFAQFDAEAAHLDLMIKTPQKVQPAIGEVASQIAGFVEA